jgi:hypothetical protein
MRRFCEVGGEEEVVGYVGEEGGKNREMETKRPEDFDREAMLSLAVARRPHYRCREGAIESFPRNTVSMKSMKMKERSSYSLICLIEREKHRGCSEIDRKIFFPFF